MTIDPTHPRLRSPAAQPGSTVRLAGLGAPAPRAGRVTFLVLRDRSGLAQVVLPRAAADVAARGDDRRGGRHRDRQPPGTGRGRGDRPDRDRADRARRDTPAVELWRPHARRRAADAARPCAGDLAPSGAAGPVGAGRRQPARLPRGARRRRASPRSDAEVRGVGHRVGGQRVRVDYFGRPAYLAQSPQFYKQQLVGVFERVYEVGPVFRAEPHDTVRHLAEYVSLDVELGFVGTTATCSPCCGTSLAGMVAAIHEYAGARSNGSASTVPGGARGDPGHPLRRGAGAGGRARRRARPGPRARARAGRVGAAPSTAATSSRSRATRWPSGRSTPTPQPGDARWSNSFDLLFRGLELVTRRPAAAPPRATTTRRSGPAGRTRRLRGPYLQAFRHGMPPHGGFAIGLERWMARLVEAANIREVTLFPRDLHRLTP